MPAGGPRGLPARGRARLYRGVLRRTCDRCRREHHLLRAVHRDPRPRDPFDPARHRHREHAEHPPGGGGGRDRNARSPAGRALQLRHQPGRAALRCRGLRQPRQGPHRDVRRGDRHGAGDLGRFPAVRPERQALGSEHAANADRGHRPGHPAEAAADAASAGAGHRGGATFEGAGVGRGAWLAADLGELPAAEMGGHALAAIRRGLPRRRAGGESGRLAGRQVGVRGRRPRHGARVRARPSEPVSALLSADTHQDEEERPRGASSRTIRRLPTTA